MSTHPQNSSPSPQPTDRDALAARQAEVASQTRQRHDALLEAMHRLEAALASAAPGREQAWNQRVAQRLGELLARLREHVQAADAPDGLLAVIDATRPTLVHRVDRLRRQHADLLQQAQSLHQQVQHHGDGEVPDFRDIRQRAMWLLNALRHHQAQETDLIFESFYTDIGVGD